MTTMMMGMSPHLDEDLEPQTRTATQNLRDADPETQSLTMNQNLYGVGTLSGRVTVAKNGRPEIDRIATTAMMVPWLDVNIVMIGMTQLMRRLEHGAVRTTSKTIGATDLRDAT